MTSLPALPARKAPAPFALLVTTCALALASTLALALLAPPADAAEAAGSAATAAAAADDARYDPLRREAGLWDVDVQFFDGDGHPTGTAHGTQRNVLLANGHWITNDLVIADEASPGTPAPAAPGFQGHGVWGWDPVAKEYVDTWVDTNDGAVRTDHGFWKPETRTMHWTALQPDGEGHAVTYRMSEAFPADDRRTLTFYQVAMESGRLVKLAEMRFVKRAGS